MRVDMRLMKYHTFRWSSPAIPSRSAAGVVGTDRQAQRPIASEMGGWKGKKAPVSKLSCHLSEIG